LGLDAHHVNMDKPSVHHRMKITWLQGNSKQKFLHCVTDLQIDKDAGEIAIERKIT